MGAAKKLVYFVHVTDAEGEQHVFGPSDDVPGWAAKAITNPSAWGEDSADDHLTPPSAGPESFTQVDDTAKADGDAPGYGSLKKAELQALVDGRNADRDEDEQIEVGGTGKVADLIAALEADDVAAEDDGQ